MLLVNGINVYPRELEEVIYQFDGVKEAAVVGVNDPRKGDMVVACVAPSEGADLDDSALLALADEVKEMRDGGMFEYTDLSRRFRS